MKYVVIGMTPFAVLALFALYFLAERRAGGEAMTDVRAVLVAFLIAYVVVFVWYVMGERAALRRDGASRKTEAGPIWSKAEEAAAPDWRIAGLFVVAFVAVIVFMLIDAIL